MDGKYNSYIKVNQYLDEHPYLRFLFLELTNQCNLKCKHCGSSCPSQINCNQVDTAILLKLIDSIALRARPGDLMFCITGGEPLLREDWNVICEHIASKGFSWGMTTNGTLITEETVEVMKKAKMQTISVSLDGLKEKHEWLRNVKGCFDQAVNGIQLLVRSAAFRCVQVTTVVNTRNILELPALYEFLKELHIDSWKITPTEPIGIARRNDDLFLSDEQHLYLLEYILKMRREGAMAVTYGCSHFLPEKYDACVRRNHFHCGAGTSAASIAASGDILACLDIEDRNRSKQGNIYCDDFWDVWDHRYQMFRQPRCLDQAICAQCEENEFCRGDSWHSWDFEHQKPRVCLRKLLERLG